MGSREKKSAEIEPGGMLLMITISLTVILLAFFIMLNSIARESEEKKKVALGSIAESFDTMSEGDAFFEEEEGGEVPTDQLQLENKYIDFSDLPIDKEKLVKQIQVIPERRGSLLRISAKQLFETGGVNLRPESYELLNALANLIVKNNYPVDIAGHTDKFPIDESGVVSNREFSMLWALNVLNYLIEKGGVSPKRLTVFGWGDCRPAVFGKSRESREVNERIDLLFVHPKEEKKPKGSFIFKDFFFKAFE